MVISAHVFPSPDPPLVLYGTEFYILTATAFRALNLGSLLLLYRFESVAALRCQPQLPHEVLPRPSVVPINGGNALGYQMADLMRQGLVTVFDGFG